MLYRFLIVLIGVAFGNLAYAQSLSISSDSFVCVKDLIAFKATSNTNIISVSWNFGDGFTSNQQNPSHIYNTIGRKSVTLEAIFTGGITKTTTKQIMVHALPIPSFKLSDSTLCFHKQNLCLQDYSTMGGTTNGYHSRIILWGDGARTDTKNPGNVEECYSNYPTADKDPYQINIEITNDKGCEARWTSKVLIKEDFIPSYSIKLEPPECNAQEVCLENDSTVQRSFIKNWKWQFDNEKTDSVNWSKTCYTFSKPGYKRIQFRVELQNGCISLLDTSINVAFPQLNTDVKVVDTSLCFPTPFTFSNPLVSGANYVWTLYSKDTVPLEISGYNIVQQVKVPQPGDYLVRLQLRRNNCTVYSPFINISSLGTLADFTVLNNLQCAPEDTMYFYNLSISHPSAKNMYHWDFNDDKADKCIGYLQNCNFDTFFHARHFYTDTNCYFPKLVVTDTVSGCIDSTSKPASIINVDNVHFDYRLTRPCIGSKKEYEVYFFHNKCALDVDVVYDSLASQDFDEFRSVKVYNQVKDSNGYVSVGFAFQSGSIRKFLSPSLTDYIIDSSNICYDTLWHHNWFRLYEEPDMAIVLDKSSECIPAKSSIKYYGKDIGSLKEVRVRWGSNSTFEKYDITDSFPHIQNDFTKAGEYIVLIQLEDTFGCYNTLPLTEQLGYYNSFDTKTVICLGDTAEFADSIRYWNDPTAYWKNNTETEKLLWDFGVGLGFVDSTSAPNFYYTQKGTYQVRLATQDRRGCTDTFMLAVEVGGINAFIAQKDRIYLCSQVIQFFDSSYFDNSSTNDKIKSYYWDFGDSTKISYLINPSHLYEGSGSYILTHAVESEAGCIDTAVFDIYIQGPEPYFDIVSDTIGCKPFKVEFKSESNRISNFLWRLGDKDGTTFYSSKDTSFDFSYLEPGIYYIYLDGSDSFYNNDTENYYTCSSVFPDTTKPVFETRRIIVKDIPEADFNFPTPVCANQPVLFQSTSHPRYTSFSWFVNNADLNFDSSTIQHVFTGPGTYVVGLKPSFEPDLNTERYCFDSATYTINVSEVEAHFTYQVENRCSKVLFFDSSKNAVEYQWDFDHYLANTSFDNKQIAEHTYYPDTGRFNPCLFVLNNEGCRDTFCQEIDLQYYEELILYNVYTPGDDGKNDAFFFDTHNTSHYQLQIYNRWGELVFESTNPLEKWLGNHFKNGMPLPESTYFYVLSYAFHCDNKKNTIEGTVELIR